MRRSRSIIGKSIPLYFASTVVILLIAGYVYLVLESGVNPGVNNYGDGLWLALTTMSTIGDDVSPMTAGGRIVSAFMVFVGFGFLMVLSMNLAIALTEREKELAASNKEIIEKLERIERIHKKRRGR